MVIQTFGDILYYPEDGCLVEFPSPESLKHRILISTKLPQEDAEDKSVKGKDISDPWNELLEELDAEERVRAEKEACVDTISDALTHFHSDFW